MVYEAIFFAGLRIKNVKALKADYYLNLRDQVGNPARWTVFLGNNNTGKTTLLRCLASMQVVKSHHNNGEHTYSIPVELLFKRDYSNISNPDLIVVENIVNADLLYSNVVNGTVTTKPTLPHSDQVDKYFGFTNYNDSSTSYGYKIANEYTSAYKIFENLKIYGYGASRRISEPTLSYEDNDEYGVDSLFSNKKDLLNIEEWLFQLDYAKKNGSTRANILLNTFLDIMINEIFPGLESVKFFSSEKFKPEVKVLVDGKWLYINDLGYGYQATMAWLADLVKRMFDRYPNLDNPLHGPAIVLVDEIDLHLHPEWQRKIIKYLSDLFPNTQFIVTAHSPLIVQSAENVNLIMLEKDDETGSINVRQQFGSFQGWTVEEILRELMDMGEKTRSDRFLKLLNDFEEGLNKDNYDKAKIAYDELDKILHPASSQRKLLSMQLSSLIPA